MPWINMISENEAEGELAEIYCELIEPWGGVDNIMKIHSLSIESLKAHMLLYKTVMYGQSPIKRAYREMIAVVTSAANKCEYWVIHHGKGLFRLTKNQSLVDQLKDDYKKADITNKEKAMLDYSYKLTLFPWDMKKSDVDDLKKAGFFDREILDINQIVSYYAYVNRLADGLGVELENI